MIFHLQSKYGFDIPSHYNVELKIIIIYIIYLFIFIIYLIITYNLNKAALKKTQ